MDQEALSRALPIVAEWEPLIMHALPDQWAITMGKLTDEMHDEWLALPQPPTSSAATAVCALATMGILEITESGNIRRPAITEAASETRHIQVA